MGQEPVVGEGYCAAGEESKLRRAIDLITSIISLSYDIRVFSGKWKMIRDRLEELSAGLETAGTCHNPTVNQPLSDFVQAIPQTLGVCHDLANRCINISYSGKLLMQSDLDVVLVKLDAHIRRLSAVYAAGVLSNGFALVVSRPGPGASRDDLRFYVKDLATRMKIGDSTMKRQALVALNQIVLDDDKCARVVVETDEILGLLPKFLDSPEIEIREESAKVISVICGFNSYKGLLVAAGVVAPLVRVLECGSVKGKEYSITSLLKLTENSDNAWSVSANGGVTSLLHICCKEKDEKLRSKLISPACGVLKNLAGVEEIKKFLVEEGSIPAFIKLVKASDEPTQVSSIEFLQAIADGDESIRQAIVREGGLREIVLVLDPNSSSTSYKSREAALMAVESLCSSSAHSFRSLVSYGFMNQLLHFLQKGEISLQELAFKVAFRLCGASEEAKKVMGEAGFMPEFIKFLESRSYEIRQMAAEALSSMIMVPRNRKRLVQEERNVAVILQLIDDPNEISDFINGILGLVVSEPVQTVAWKFSEMADESVGCLKEGIQETLLKEDHQQQLQSLRGLLNNRSDLTLETLLKCHRDQLEILVAIKTGVAYYLRCGDSISSVDLAEIFLNFKCRNPNCGSVLPVDECDCKFCSKKGGFCSMCMCLVCSKFDTASNTCGWVGCDFCSHWCHTDCGLQKSYIRNGQSVRSTQGTSEMQFYCVACDHPSEMYGFVTDVFKTCAAEWKADTMIKELECVKRIFTSSNDPRGKLLHGIASQLLIRLKAGSNLQEIYNQIMGFFKNCDFKLGNVSASSGRELQALAKNNTNRSSEMATSTENPIWFKTVPSKDLTRADNVGTMIPSTEGSSAGKNRRSIWDSDEMQRMMSDGERKSMPTAAPTPVVDELESLVKIKQAESKMFQSRADDARREADRLKRIAIAKSEKIDEEYSARVAKVQLAQVEETRRQKLEELQVLERSHQEYTNMKTRMQEDIKELLLRMEDAKKNVVHG